MGRIFSLLTVVAVTMILVVGGCVYWLANTRIAQARQDSATIVVSAVASTISQKIDLLNRTLNKMAQDPEVLLAVTRADPVALAAVAAKLEKFFPDALKIRLLLPGVSEIDEKNSPRMGFADLDMVRETFANNQPPEIQGYEGVDRHLAMTRRIMHNNQAVGVILASLQYDFFNKSLQTAAVKNGRIELRQGQQVLGASGVQADSGQGDDVQIKVANTDWKLHYHYAAGTDLAEITRVASLIVVPMLLTILAFLFGYRRLSGLLAQNFDSVLSACKDMMTDKPQGSYPVDFTEAKAVIAALVQFKWTLAHDDPDAIAGDLDTDRRIALDLNKPAADTDDAVKAPAIIAEPKSKPAAGKDDMASIFRAYDIRGIVGKTLTRERVYDIGRALGTDAKDHGCKTIVMGRDGRLSSPALAEVLAQGIISTGRNVLDIGQVPTPLLYFVAQRTQGHSGVMITGSHNPADYNGLKIVVDGETLSGERIQQIRRRIASLSYAGGETGVIETNGSYVNDYIDTIAADMHIARPMLVVLDCGNGVAGELGPKLLKIMGCEVVELFCNIDGNFPNHHPDPSKPENLAELIRSVKHYQADLGIAFDGDGDRLGVVDSNGKIIWPDRQMMLFAKAVLASKPGSEIIFDVKCTRHLAAQITKYGGKPVMWKTGHSLMKAKLKATGAALAGEMSGHIFFKDRWFGFDDALYSAARLIEILSNDMRSSAEIFAEFPDSINTPELAVEMVEGENFSFMDSLYAEADFTDGEITDIDGMRVDFPYGWGLVRASNTTPSLVIRFEADSQDALLDIQERFRQLMTKIKPDIVLPF